MMTWTYHDRVSARALALCLAVLIAIAVPATAEAQRSDEEKQWQVSLETGRSALDSGNVAVAESFARKAVRDAMLLATEKQRSLALADSYQLLARVLANKGDFGQADSVMNQAIAIRREVQPADSPDLGRAVLQYADIQRLRGDYAQADQLYRNSIDAIASGLGPGHILLSRAYYGLALSQTSQGYTEAADRSLLQAISILGQQESVVLRENLFDLRPFADKYVELGRLDDAERVLRQSLDLYSRHYAVDHPYYEEALLALGRLQLDRGRTDAARATFEQGTNEMLAGMGQGSERVAATMEKIAELFKTYAQPEDTEAYYVKALEVRQRSVGATEGDKVRSLTKLGDLYRQRGNKQKAEEFYRQAIQIGETRLPPRSVEVAYAYSNLALLLWDRGDIAGAERLWEDALAIYEEKLGPNDVNVATVAFNLGQLRHGQGEFAAAEPLYKKALAIREARLGPADPATLETVNMYSLLLDRVGRPDEAARLRARAN